MALMWRRRRRRRREALCWCSGWLLLFIIINRRWDVWKREEGDHPQSFFSAEDHGSVQVRVEALQAFPTPPPLLAVGAILVDHY